MVVSNIYVFLHPYLGKIPILTCTSSRGLKPPTRYDSPYAWKPNDLVNDLYVGRFEPKMEGQTPKTKVSWVPRYVLCTHITLVSFFQDTDSCA